MTIQRVSWWLNNTIPDKAYAIAHIARYKPTTLGVTQDVDLAVRCYAASPTTHIYQRDYEEHDDENWDVHSPHYQSPQAWVDLHTSWGHPEIYRYILNEPGMSDVLRLVTWLCEVIDELHKRGCKAVVGNFAVGTWQADTLLTGQFDPLLYKLAQYPEFILGIHEYTLAALPFGIGQMPPDALLNPTMMQPDQWRKTPLSLTPDPANRGLNSYWWLGRGTWFVLRARQLGIVEPRLWCTEFGWGLTDVHNAQGNVKDQLIRKWGISGGYGDIEGANALLNIWNAYWSSLGWNKERMAFEQLHWLEGVLPECYLGVDVWAWLHSEPWYTQNGDDLSQWFGLHQLLEGAIIIPPSPPPEVNVSIGKLTVEVDINGVFESQTAAPTFIHLDPKKLGGARLNVRSMPNGALYKQQITGGEPVIWLPDFVPVWAGRNNWRLLYVFGDWRWAAILDGVTFGP